MCFESINNEDNLRSYNRIARSYSGDEPVEDDPVMRLTCRQLFADRLPGKHVLEVGCGPGIDADFLHKMGLEVTATDYSPEFAEIVTERYPHLKVRCMDMTQPDLPEESFDGIYGFACFLHIPRNLANETLHKLRRLLRPEGILFLGLIKSTKLDKYVIPDWGGLEDNPMLFTCYEESDIEARLNEAGFDRVEFHYTPSPVYETMPRLVERGVCAYQVIARNR